VTMAALDDDDDGRRDGGAMKRRAEVLEFCETCEHYHGPGSTCAECGHVRAGRASVDDVHGSAVDDEEDDEEDEDEDEDEHIACGTSGAARGGSGAGVSTAMVEIIERFLVCGAFEHTCSERALVMLGVRTVMNAVPTCSPCCSGKHLAVMTLGTEDSTPDGNIDYHQCCGRLAALHVKSMKTDEAHPQRVLVYCMSGRSRAPAIAVAYMMFSRKMSLKDAIGYVKDRYPAGHQGVKFKSEDLVALEKFDRELRANRTA
jgi:dual specificity MAP kinase phosphatase